MTATSTTHSSATASSAERPPGKGRPRRGRVWLWILGVFLALVAAVLIFLSLFNWDWFRPPLAKLLSSNLHRPVRIQGHLRVHLFSWTPSATLGGLEIGEPAWAPKTDLADVQGITVKVKLLPLLTGKVEVPLLQIDQPKVFMFQEKSGLANWDFSNGKKPGKPAKLPAIQNFIINDGKLAVTSLQRKLKFTGTVFAHEKANGSGQEGFRLAGTGTLNAKSFLMNITGGPLLNVRPDKPYPFSLDVRAADTHVTAKGDVPHPFNMGQLNADITWSGHDLADLYYLTGVTLPNTPPYSISGRFRRDGMVNYFNNFQGRVGGSDLEGNLKVAKTDDNRPELTADLQSRVLDFKDLGALFGATGKNKPTGVRLATTPATANHRLLPDAPLDATRIRTTDAHVTYRALTVKAAPNLPLRQVSIGVDLDHGLLTLNPIDLYFPQGRLSGDARINARSAVQSDAVDLRVTGIQMANFLSKAKTPGPPPIEGTLDARAKLTATGNSIHTAAANSNGEVTVVIPKGVIRQAFAELLGIDATKGLFLLLSKNTHETNIRCAVADFRVQNGQLQARELLIDTDVVQVNGTGDINLNDETINLQFQGKPKQFRLIRINAPITVGGHLANPAFGIKPVGAIAQAGVAVVLAAAVNPLLLILPFVNLSYAHDANCTGLVDVAKAQGAPVKVSATTRAHH